MTSHRLVVADLERQLAHWLGAARTFCDAEEFAAAPAWRSLEADVGLPLRHQLRTTVELLLRAGRAAEDLVRTARSSPEAVPRAHRSVQSFRRLYGQVEVTLDFFGDAVNSRTSPNLSVALGALDALAVRSMQPLLQPLGRPVPPVLTYIDKGLGASILRAGVRLWVPGAVNPVASIKVVRHNLYRPTSLFHETGHQVAHLTGWTAALSAALGEVLADDRALAATWRSWASEIVADVFAFAHTGYAAVAALYDVVGDDDSIHRWVVGDPHPVGWLRTLLGTAMCRHVFGPGVWDELEQAVLEAHPPARAEPTTAALLVRSRTRLPTIAAACLDAAIPGFGNRPIGAFVDPRRVSPAALAELERSAGPALWTSPHWKASEGIRIVALSGLREAQRPEQAAEWIDRARHWLIGAAARAA